jgi:transcriptional antiterminator RfaH
LSGTSNKQRWYVASTAQHLEGRALVNLQAQGFATYLPRRTKTIKHARQFRTIEGPLFPGYLFVAFDLSRESWRAINGTFGIRSLIMSGERPAPVPVGVVEALMAMQDSLGRISFASNLQLGKEVRLLAGPFAEMVGQLVACDDAGRVQVLLNLLGTQVHVRTKAEMLIPA